MTYSTTVFSYMFVAVVLARLFFQVFLFLLKTMFSLDIAGILLYNADLLLTELKFSARSAKKENLSTAHFKQTLAVEYTVTEVKMTSTLKEKPSDLVCFMTLPLINLLL